jgi:Phage tail tube protein
MAQPTTAKFGKMIISLGEHAPGTPVAVTSLSNANPAVVTVGASDITKFKNGDIVVIAGATGTGMTVANGSHSISSVGSPANTFKLTGVNTSAGTAPQTTGVTAAPPSATITYTSPCGFTSKGVTLSKNLQEVNIPDCADPDAPIWVGRDVISQSATITGDGVAAGESLPDWDDAFMTTAPVPMRVEITYDGLGKKTVEGMFHVDSEAISVEAGGRVNLAINAQSDGAILATWTTLP